MIDIHIQLVQRLFLISETSLNQTVSNPVLLINNFPVKLLIFLSQLNHRFFLDLKQVQILLPNFLHSHQHTFNFSKKQLTVKLSTNSIIFRSSSSNLYNNSFFASLVVLPCNNCSFRAKAVKSICVSIVFYIIFLSFFYRFDKFWPFCSSSSIQFKGATKFRK